MTIPSASESARQFVEARGAMGALWGINRSVARVHALLMATEGPLSLDEIAEQLQISKGNASMSLRELRTFGVVRQVEAPGDRRDFYVTEPDVWTMFFRILRENGSGASSIPPWRPSTGSWSSPAPRARSSAV